MTTAVVDNKTAWGELFASMRGDLLEAHLPTLRQVAAQADINVMQQELIYNLSPKDALAELMPKIIEILNGGGLRSRRLLKTLMRLNEKAKWLETKTPFFAYSFLEAKFESVTFSLVKRNGEMSVKYAVLKFFHARMSTLIHACEVPEKYIVNMNDNAVYHWIFDRSEHDTRYNSITLLHDIEQAHAEWLIDYRLLMQQLAEV